MAAKIGPWPAPRKRRAAHPDLRVVIARSEKVTEALRAGFSLADALEYGDEAARRVRDQIERAKARKEMSR